MQDEDEIERLLMAHSLRLQDILEAAHRRIEAGQGIPHEEFWREMEVERSKTSQPDRAVPKKRMAQ
jgi:hypothetical protein